MPKTIVPFGLVLFTIVKFAVGPCQEIKGWLHGSLLPELEEDGGVNVGKAVGNAKPGASNSGVLEVGKAGGLSVGRGIGLAVSVGGIEVLVGIAWRVCAAIV